MKNNLFLISGLSLAMAGCVTFDALPSTKSSFECKAPDGVLCDSMTGVIANAATGNLPSQQVNRKNSNSKKTIVKNISSEYAPRPLPIYEYTGLPILSQPKTIRVWIAPWEGSDRTLFDQQFFYMVIDNWRWNIEHNSNRIINKYSPSGVVKAPIEYELVSYEEPQEKAQKLQTGAELANFAESSVVPVQDNNADKEDIRQSNIDISQFTQQ